MRAWVGGYEKQRCAQIGTEKAGTTEGIQLAEEGGSKSGEIFQGFCCDMYF